VKALSKVQAAIAAIILVNFLLLPTLWFRLFGPTAEPLGMLLFQLIVFLFAGLATVSWTQPRRALRLALNAAIGLAATTAALGAMYGLYMQFAWGPAAMFAMLILGLVFVKPRAHRMATAFGRAPGNPAESCLPGATFRSSSRM